MRTPRTKRPAAPAPLLLLLLLLCATRGAALAQDAAPSPTPAPPKPSPQQSRPAQPGGAADAAKAETASAFISGRVLGEGGEPLHGAFVYATPRNSYVMALGRRTTTTDEDGSFRLNGVEPGFYNISVTAPGYVNEVDPQTGRGPGPYRAGDTATIRMVKGGVITGKVTDQQGEPFVALPVRASRVRDFEGRSLGNVTLEDKTDDRGVYRIFGLPPGVYVVMAGGSRQFSGPFPSIFDRDVPTFYPSATRDAAAEVVVRPGQESSGIDIRHREELGHRVTGTVELPATITPSEGTISVTLNYGSGGLYAGSHFLPLSSESRSFSVEGMADGEYDLHATVAGRAGVLATSPTQRVTVRGADVTGLRLSLAPLGSIAGKLAFEPVAEADRARPECKDLPAPPPPQEVLVSARLFRAAGERPPQRPFRSADTMPDSDGAFTLHNLDAGRYQLAVTPPDERFYVRVVQLPARAATAAPATPTPRRADAAAKGGAQSAARPATGDVVSLGAGQHLTGVLIRVAAGAATLGGTAAGREGAPQPSWNAQSRVYLVPAEREHADDPLRYAEATPAQDGSFAFKSVAPGRYRALARESGAEPSGPSARPLFWDAAGRAQLRRDAESSGAPVELQPCQRATDFTLRLQ